MAVPLCVGPCVLFTIGVGWDHRLNMELDLRSLFGLLCTAVLIGWDPTTPLPPHLGSYTRSLLVSQDRRHLFVTPWLRLLYNLSFMFWAGLGVDINTTNYSMSEAMLSLNNIALSSHHVKQVSFISWFFFKILWPFFAFYYSQKLFMSLKLLKPINVPKI